MMSGSHDYNRESHDNRKHDQNKSLYYLVKHVVLYMLSFSYMPKMLVCAIVILIVEGDYN